MSSGVEQAYYSILQRGGAGAAGCSYRCAVRRRYLYLYTRHTRYDNHRRRAERGERPQGINMCT
jgi:hypothetical protein